MILEEELRKIIGQYQLTQDELYRYDDKLMLVSARGIRKIITAEKLNVSKRVFIDPSGGVIVIARVEKGSLFTEGYSFYESTGESKLGLNTTFKFPVAVAESRAQGRAVLMSIGLYEKGIISEAELEQEVEAEAITTKRKEQVNVAVNGLSEKLALRRGAKPKPE